MPLQTTGIADRVLAQITMEIRAEMTRQSETQATVAAYMHISEAAISRKLTGDRRLSVADLLRFAEFLDVPAADLLGRAEAHTAKRSA